MKPFAKLFVWVSISLATLSMGCAQMNGGSTSGAGSATPSTSRGTVSIENTGPKRVSQGTQGDSLAACLSRIPSDASAGQRMIATGTCERDAANRTPIDVVPGQ
jgi:hypothetical protein